ncbi:MAG: transposase, partial [Solirubrobacteraceae bacterium]
DQTSRVGKLTRQGSSPLRWALYEAAQSATRAQSPDYAHYHALRASGMTHTRAPLTIARKIARRSYHLLNKLGADALAPSTPEPNLHHRLQSRPTINRCGPSGQLPQLPRHPPRRS